VVDEGVVQGDEVDEALGCLREVCGRLGARRPQGLEVSAQGARGAEPAQLVCDLRGTLTGAGSCGARMGRAKRCPSSTLVLAKLPVEVYPPEQGEVGLDQPVDGG